LANGYTSAKNDAVALQQALEAIQTASAEESAITHGINNYCQRKR
jgi:hypothetical protein